MSTMESRQQESAPLIESMLYCRLCDHPEIFCNEYKRSNRNRGLKILRCFPHCCPYHMERSYCGSALNVALKLADSIAPETMNEFLVLARFEPVSEWDDAWPIGSYVNAEEVLPNIQSEENPEGKWIRGVEEPSTVVTAALKAATGLTSDHVMVFLLNGSVYSRWYYDWESGANKSQRLMTHVLKSYVFQKVPPNISDESSGIQHKSGSSNESSLRVIATVASPEFKLVSYRRARTDHAIISNVRVVGGDTPHVHLSNIVTSRTSSNESDVTNNDSAISHCVAITQSSPNFQLGTDTESIKQAHRLESLENSMGNSREKSNTFDRVSPSDCMSNHQEYKSVDQDAQEEAKESLSLTMLFEEHLYWAEENRDATCIAKNLAIIYWFIRWTPLVDYSTFADQLVRIIHRDVLLPLVYPNGQVDEFNCFTRELFPHNGVLTSHLSATSNSLQKDLEPLLRVLAGIVLWIIAADTRTHLGVFFHHNSHNLLNKKVLRENYTAWLRDVEHTLAHHILSPTKWNNLGDLADEIIAFIFSVERYRKYRPKIRQILEAQVAPGYTSFVSQVRSIYISRTTNDEEKSSMPSSILSVGNSRRAIEKYWTGEWLMDMNQAKWVPESRKCADISLYTIFNVLSQLARIYLIVDIQTVSMKLLSKLNFDGQNNDNYGMLLVLDGKDRTFRQFPNSLSSSLVSGPEGNYVGNMEQDNNSPDSIKVNLNVYRYALKEDVHSSVYSSQDDESTSKFNVYLTRLLLAPSESHGLLVRGDIFQSVSHSMDTSGVEGSSQIDQHFTRSSVDRGLSSPMHERNERNVEWEWDLIGSFRYHYYKVAE